MLTSNDATSSRVVASFFFSLLCGALLLASGCSTSGQTLSSSENTSAINHSTEFSNRIYAGAGLLASRLSPDAEDNEEFSVTEESSAGGSLTLGYDINHRFSLDGSLSYLGEAEFSPAGTIDYRVGQLSALMYVSNTHRRQTRTGLSAFGRLGAGIMKNESSDVPFKRLNDVHLVAGLGLEYGFRSGIALRAELISQDTDAQYGQLGLLFRFDTQQVSDTDDVSESKPASVEEKTPAPATLIKPIKPTDVAPPTPIDTDRDGVANSVDKCPKTRLRRPVKADGCELFSGRVAGITFSPGSERLTLEAKGILDKVAADLMKYPDIRLAIEAHTDSEGAAPFNLTLSKRRALEVTRYLIDAGIYPTRLLPRAYGETRPIADNDTATGRAANRRIEFNVIPQDQ